MTLEEAEAKIVELEGVIAGNEETIAGLEDNAGKLSDEDQKKIEQKAYNQGFDKAKNQFEGEKKDLLNKEDVDKMLSDRDHAHNVQTELRKMGINSPKIALKLIDEDDVKSIGTDDFKVDDFVKKYNNVLVFKDQESGNHTPILKDNKDVEKQKLTAESYAGLSTKEQSELSADEKIELLKG